MGATPTKLMTFAEFEQLPDEVCRRRELRHGELVEVPPPQHIHRLIQDRLVDLLKPLAGNGYGGIEIAFRALPQYENRVADVAYVTRERWERIADNDNLRGAPELVIEILSPSNTKAMMRERAALCLANGCLEFWVLDEKKRQVAVSTPNGVTMTYRSAQVIPLQLFGDASLPVDRIFEK
ncbi:MAG: Uma2 family endonuclease [Bryobacteraceae bacterium]|jgi:Uma2 family endonuclease